MISWHYGLELNNYHLSHPWCYSGDDHYSEWMPQASWNPAGPAWQTLSLDRGPGPRPSPGVGPGPELDPDPQWLEDPVHLDQFTKEPEGTACLRWATWQSMLGKYKVMLDAGRFLGLHPRRPPSVGQLVAVFLPHQGSHLLTLTLHVITGHSVVSHTCKTIESLSLQVCTSSIVTHS